MAEQQEPLAGLTVLDLTTNVCTAFTTVLFADLGAEVVTVEPPGGSTVRAMAAAPFYFRGKKSIVLDLHDESDLAVARELAADADVVVEAFGAGVADRLGLGYDALRERNPGLVYTSITGFGHSGPFSHLQTYEAVAMAKSGSMYGNIVPHRSGQPVMTIPLGATHGVALLAQQGTFVALHEREAHGHGQRVDATMAQGLLSHDPWSYFIKVLAARYPDAFKGMPAPSHARPVPQTWLTFGLMNGYTKDGRWMQFAHATPRQFDDFMRVLGLAPLLATPEWKDAPNHADDNVRDQWWTKMLEVVNSKTSEEWQAIFDEEPNVFAEIYRRPDEWFEHPQIVHDNHAVTVDDPVRGPVRQPGSLMKLSKTTANPTRPMHDLDADGAELRARRATSHPPTGEPPVGRPPLEGVTILDLGTFYAGPFGSTMLTDQGARVIKVEPLDGDPIRFQMPMPEVSGVRVTQNKESIAIDAFSEEGKKVLTELVKKADVILHCYRGGVAERMGLDFESVVKINPDVMYHHGVGYGIDGPYCRKQAFAPTIAAGSGFASRSGGGGVEGEQLTIDEIKNESLRLAGVQSGHPDGFAALGVGVALAADIYLKDRGHGGQTTLTSMVSTMGHMMSDVMVDYAGAPAPAKPDPDHYGFNALYRLYEAADGGWIVLCAPTESAWQQLRNALDNEELRDARFATSAARESNDSALIDLLSDVFKQRAANAWEQSLSAAGVGCAEVAPSTGALGVGMFEPGNVADHMGWLVTVTHPLFDEHPRTTELVELSRSGSVLGPGEQIGGHSRAILEELGYDDAAIESLHADRIVNWP